MAILFSLTTIFTACETPDQGKEDSKLEIDITNAIVCNAMSLYNNGPIASFYPSLKEYYFEAYTEGITYNPKTGSLTGDGMVIALAQVISYENDFIPKTTKYTPFEVVNNQVETIFEGGAASLSVYVVENGKVQQAESFSTADFKAQYIGNAENMTFAVEGDFDGEHMVFAFTGAPALYSLASYQTEDIDAAKYEGVENYASAEVIYYDNASSFFSLNVIEVILIDSKQTAFADFFCYGSLKDPKNVYGTFTVADEHAVGTMAKSPGVYVDKEGSYASPSFVARNYSQNGADYYFVDGGSISIEEGKISFDITSVGGSKISTVYEGKISVKSYDQAYNAPRANVPAITTTKQGQPLNYAPIKF